LAFALGDDVGVEDDAAALEKGDDAGATEGKESFLVSLSHRLAGSEVLMDAADIGGADFDHRNRPKGGGINRRHLPPVFDQVPEIAAKGERADRIEPPRY